MARKNETQNALGSKTETTAGPPIPDPEQGADREFDIDEVFRRLRDGLRDHTDAMMFVLRDQGFGSPFEILVGTLISVRTRDETTRQVCLRLFAVARTPEQLLQLSEEQLIELLNGALYPAVKARDLREIARRIMEEHEGRVPDSLEGLMAFRGVGPKVAALTLALGFGQPAICVDTHVHRIANRWGYVSAKTPEKTADALALKLPERYWIEINQRLVALGKAICLPGIPRCPECPVEAFCAKVGVITPDPKLKPRMSRPRKSAKPETQTQTQDRKDDEPS